MTKLTILAFFMVFVVGNPFLRAQNSEAIGGEWYLQTEDKKCRLFIHEVGKGDPVVVIHGGPGAGYRYMTGIVKGQRYYQSNEGLGLREMPPKEILSSFRRPLSHFTAKY